MNSLRKLNHPIWDVFQLVNQETKIIKSHPGQIHSILQSVYCVFTYVQAYTYVKRGRLATNRTLGYICLHQLITESL